MKYTTLPNTQIEVSRLAMGCWALAGDMTWGPQDEQDSLNAIAAAIDAGVTLFDTAEMYGDGLSEQVLGRGLLGRRDRVVIASKFNPEHNGPEELIATCERSLGYLQTDYLDLYQIHWSNPDVPVEATWAALEKLKEQGKVRAIGVSNFGTADLSDLLTTARPVTNQLPYSLVYRAIEYAILPQCVAEEIGVLCYSPLQHGLLTGKYATAEDVPVGKSRSRHFSRDREKTRHGEPGCEFETFAALDAIRKISDELGRPMTEVALAWLLHQQGVTSVICGFRDKWQAERNVAAAELELSDDLLNALDEATTPVKDALGPNPDMWESTARSRYR